MSVPDILKWIQAKYFVPLQDILQVPDTERKKKKRGRESSAIDLNTFRSLSVSNHTPVVRFSLLTKKTQQELGWGIQP